MAIYGNKPPFAMTHGNTARLSALQTHANNPRLRAYAVYQSWYTARCLVPKETYKETQSRTKETYKET